jgi:hypothetical protein
VGSYRSVWNRAWGVPAGTDGWVRSIGFVVEEVWLPVWAAFTKGEGLAFVSASH